MFISVVPNRNSKPAILLRETYREDGKVKNRTLANLSQWSPEKLAALELVLKRASARFEKCVTNNCAHKILWAPLAFKFFSPRRRPN